MSDRIAFKSTVSLEGRRLMGFVQLAGSRTRRNGEWLEVDPAAVVKADASDVIGRWEHDPSKVLGRSSNGTVRLSRTDQGIAYEIDLPETTYANDVLALVNRGDVRGSSFEIEGLRSTFHTDPEDGSRIRRITHIDRLTDVSPVTDPAFTNSSVAAFSQEKDMDKDTAPEKVEKVEDPPKAEPTVKFAKGDDERDQFAAFEAAGRRLSTADLEAVMDNIMTETKGNPKGEMLSRYEAFARVHGERTSVDAVEEERASRMKALHDLRLGRIPKAPDGQIFASDEYNHAFTRYLRTGDARGLEQFAQSIAGDGTQGGYMVPDGFLNRIVETKVAYGGIQQVAEVITTADGQNIRWPSNDDTGNSAAIATEGSAVGSGGADLTFGTVSLDAYSYDATGTGNVPLLVSKELIQDAAFDVEAFVGRKLGQRLGRKMAADYATADGSSKPKGLFAASADTMTATTLYAAFAEHVLQVDQEYRESGNCRWVFGDTTYSKVLTSVDLNGRPLFTPSAEAGGSGRPGGFVLGYPVTFDQGAGSLVAFGDIRQAFIIRNVRGISVDVDPYTNIKSRQLAFHAWARTDSDIQDSAAVSVSEYSTVSADATA